MVAPRILFVCQGNVGRSQMAEGFYNHFVGSKTATSAGVDDVASKYGGHPTQEIIAIMLEVGINVSGHTIKQVTPEIVQKATLVVVLCSPAICPSFLLTGDPKVIFEEVLDPYRMDLDTTREIRDHIKNIVLKLIKGELN